MVCRLKQDQCKGSISVFLSLILLLVLSLLFTVIEGARVGTAKVYAHRALNTAMDSVLAEYYGPLWEEYHIFGYYTGEGTEEKQQQRIITKLKEDVDYTFHPTKDLDGLSGRHFTELYGLTTEQIKLSALTRLTDYSGKLLINEAVEYMKYRQVGDGVEQLLDKLSLLEAPGKVSYILEEKQKLEEKLIVIDQGILELMRLMDGLDTKSKGLQWNDDGTIKTTQYFIKMICREEVSMKNVGLNQKELYTELQTKYINPVSCFGPILSSLETVGQINRQIEAVTSERELLENTRIEAKTKLAGFEAMKNKTKSIKKQIIAMRETINNLEAQIQGIDNEINLQNTKRLSLMGEITDNRQRLTSLMIQIEPLIDKALSCIRQLSVNRKEIMPLIDQYEVLMEEQSTELGPEVLEGLQEGLSELKKYSSNETLGYNFEEMEVILEADRKVLSDVDNQLARADLELQQGRYGASGQSFREAQRLLGNYQIDGLTLDYSTLVCHKTWMDSPLKQVGGLLEGQILDLVMEPDKISKLSLPDTALLPSNQRNKAFDGTDYLSKLTAFFQSFVRKANDLDTGIADTGFTNDLQPGSVMEDGMNKALQLFLFQEYLIGHFGLYQADESKAMLQKPSVLTYEQEYLLAGRSEDRENLSSVVARILLIRAGLDFVSILGDKTKREEARLAAAAMVGFTGLPVLVGAVQVAILIGWAFAEALLDVSTLMLGKSVPVMKKKLTMELQEIFLINREYLRKKAEQAAEPNQLSMSYTDYLGLFLLMENQEELACRAMDLMQENIALRYLVKSFTFKDCIFGFEVNAKFQIRSGFTRNVFIARILNKGADGFRMTDNSACSY